MFNNYQEFNQDAQRHQELVEFAKASKNKK